ncbi:DUF547 domain-containing protein [Crocinitomicaceae bacterium]|nr:DUF547 domain-containing protein [Crocinitomicaceae bacterium]
MKKTLYSSLFVLTIIVTACSGSDDKSNESKEADKKTEQSKDKDMDQVDSEIEIKDSIVEVVTNEDGEEVQVITNDEGKKVIVSEDGTETVVNPDDIKTSTVTVEAKPEPNNTTQKDDTPDFNIHEYKKLDALLKKHVSSAGNVNYKDIKENRSELDAIIEEFKQTTVESSWSKNQKLAFWINTYNIFTIKLIVDNYPTSSITNITAKPWEKKIVTIGSNTYSLNHVENGIIRKQFNEPRIHFALNCASKSCPILLNKAFTAGNLNSLLTSQTKKFLNDTSKNTFSKKEAKISKIFDWYGEDFPDVMGFIKKYHPMDYDPKKTSYMEYSWDLNK